MLGCKVLNLNFDKIIDDLVIQVHRKTKAIQNIL